MLRWWTILRQVAAVVAVLLNITPTAVRMNSMLSIYAVRNDELVYQVRAAVPRAKATMFRAPDARNSRLESVATKVHSPL